MFNFITPVKQMHKGPYDFPIFLYSIFWIDNVMQTFPLGQDNALFTFNLVKYVPNGFPVKLLFIKCIPF